MTLVSSGLISLGGNATSGGSNVSIEYELRSSYGNTTTGTNQISLNDSAVRNLAGISSGAISFSSLYGKSALTTWFSYATNLYDSGSAIVASDPSGNIIQLALATHTGGYSMIMKTSSAGSLIWAKTANVYFQKMVVDSAGNIYLVGSNYLVKLDSSGNISWQKQIASATINSVTVDSSGNVYILHNIGTYSYIFCFNSSGTLVWQKILIISYVGQITTDGTNVYFSLYQSASPFNSYVGAITCSTGAAVWAKTISSTSYYTRGVRNGMTQDASGNLYISGFYQLTNSPYTAYPILMSITASTGVLNWQKTYTNITNQFTSCSYSSNNNSLLLTDGSSTVLLLNAAGAVQWTRSISGSTYNFYSGSSYQGITISTDYNNVGYQVSMGGYYSINAGSFSFTGDYTNTLVELPLDGTKTGAYSSASQTITYASSTAAVDSASTLTYTTLSLTPMTTFYTPTTSALSFTSVTPTLEFVTI